MDNDYFWVNAIFIVILLTIYLTIIRRIYKQKIHLYIYTAVWALLVLGNQIVGKPYTIDIQTLIVVYSAWLTFLIGAIGVYLYYTPEKINVEKTVLYSVKRLQFSLVVLIFLSLIANYYFYQTSFAKLQGVNNLTYLRTSAARDVLTEPNMFYNLFGRSYNIYIPMAFLLYYRQKLSTFLLAAILVVAFLTSAAAFTRAPILYVLVCIIVSVVLSGKQIRLNKTTISIAASFLGMLYYLTNEINTQLSQVKIKNADELLVNSFFVYIWGGIRAYQTILEGTYRDFGSKLYDSSFYSFDFFHYFLKRFGVIDKYPNLIREYMPGDVLPTNVYTYLDCFTLDFGITGALVGSLIIGIITTYFAVQAQFKRTITMMSIYCFCCMGMAIIFMNNEFIRNTVFLMLIPLAFVEFLARLNMDTNPDADSISVV